MGLFPVRRQPAASRHFADYANGCRRPALTFEEARMTRETLFGGNPWGVIVRLILLSIIVGIVFSALDITPENILWRLQLLVRRLSDMGFGMIEWAIKYFLLGAVVVIPIWLIVRFLGVLGGKDKDGPPRA